MPRQFNPQPNNPAVAQLVHLHADLGGRLLRNRAEAKKLTSDMKHVEAVIQMFDPAYDVRRIAVRRRNNRNPWFRRGTVFRAVLDVLRAAEGPLTVAEICQRMLTAKGIHDPDAKALRDLSSAVRASLGDYNGKSVVRNGTPAQWAMAGGADQD